MASSIENSRHLISTVDHDCDNDAGIDDSSTINNVHIPLHYKVYRRRWFVLSLVALLAFSSQLIWLTYSPVASIVANYYEVSEYSVNLFSMLYLFLAIPMGFVATWLLDTYGLRPSLFIGAWVTAIGSLIRVISIFDFVSPSLKFPIAVTGQIISSLVYPIFVSCPTKVSENWFPENQRALATMIMTTGAGFLMGNILPPIIIAKKGVSFLLIVNSVLPLLAALLTTFGLNSSTPPSPPSASAATQVEPYWTGLKKIVKIKSYWTILILVGSAGGLFNTLNVIAEELYCIYGYTPTFSGIVLGMQSGIGIFGSLAASLFVDRTKLFDETLKITQALSSLCIAIIVVVSTLPHMEAPILIFNCVYGVFFAATFPVSLELIMEITYPIAEGTAVGLLLISMHLQGIIFTFLMEALSQPMTEYQRIHQKCGPIHSHGDNQSSWQHSVHNTNISEPRDMTVALMVYAGLSCFQSIAFILCFKAKYRRMDAEKSHHIAAIESSINVNGLEDHFVNA
ncbi:solute carrier family 49 member A3-like [Glandiceps talaboti]